MYRPGIAGGGGCRVDWMSKKVPKVGMGDSSLSSEMVGPSLGSDLHIFLMELSLLTQLLLRITIVVHRYVVC